MSTPPDTSRAGAAPTTATPTAPPSGRGSTWIDDWRPEDPVFWEQTGAKVAKRNLLFSVISEHIGFSVWSMWSVIVLFLGPVYGIDPAGKFLLTALPTLLGALLRLPYTFAVATFGGRNWTIVSALMLLIPTIGIIVVLEPGVSYTTLLIVACLAGVGGGNFASSMTNINAYYPARLKGWALGINAGGGNLGVPVVQLLGLLILATVGATNPRLLAIIYIPLILLAALGAALTMNNLSQMSNSKRAMRDVVREKHTWIISLLYIGTFGSFIGYSFAFGQVLQVQFADIFSTPVKAAYLTFIGPLIGSLIRPVGGMLADRLGGAKVSFVNFIAMALGAAVVLTASLMQSLPLYLVGFVMLFTFSGIGNGSVYKMIPAIFRSKSGSEIIAGAEPAVSMAKSQRLSGALIGIAGAIGAFGGVLVNLAFRQSFLTYKTATAAYVVFIAFYAVCIAVTWYVYLRSSKSKLEGV
ncbi:NarK/NasA family nitrate transporter [Nakamurella flavida]|uniref:NarK/NasA family nitrate transporter n=1 Tax=Nakamurella flavida TaxID=363630 RepID=A0A938YL76_9ACTN|nr:nitrate/nitrite transporter [Nakamurella flavida]MBM9475073.1 NarK/NasA family nitrate transporter [Nakamurella flavida]MDP9776642.1 NNP family nitrate/nitrite transporter-like MFS transporter [Nakamurella flavida]